MRLTSLLMFLSCCLAGCTTPGGTGVAQIPVAPMCTLLATDSMVNPDSNSALTSERTDAGTFDGFVRLHGTSGQRGNGAIGNTRVYAFTEAWLHDPLTPVVFRAQAHPLTRTASGDTLASAWTISTQDATGAWSGPIFVGTANRGRNEVDDQAAAALTVPQLMPVGVTNPQMFACAGTRTDDDTARTTALFEFRVPTGGLRAGNFIQDLVYGDDRFVPNKPGGVFVGPATPPTPTLTSPGNRVRDGSVRCAMTQFEDVLATRELHMLTIDGGVLYHSMANDWGESRFGDGTLFNRFRAVSPWADVGQALGQNFGVIESATLVAQPRMISVFFVARGSDNRYRLWHAVRQSQGGGSWRPADDVLARTGGSPNGAVDPYDIAAGVCPLFGEEATGATGSDTELVYVMFNKAQRTMLGGRIVPTPRQWGNTTVTTIYSPLSPMHALLPSTNDTSRMHRLEGLWISTRPFADSAMPPP